MREPVVRGTTSYITHIFVQDSTSSTGAGKTGLAFGDFAVRYIRAGEALSGAITAQTIATIGTYAAPTANSNIRIKEISAANMPGMYEVQLHNDWLNTTGSRPSLTIFFTASGMAPLTVGIPLAGFNLQDEFAAVNVVQISGSAAAADNLESMYVDVITSGTVSDAGAAADDFDTDLTEVTDNHYRNQAVCFRSGVLKGQYKKITAYTGSSKNIACDAFTEAPGDGDAFVILGLQ